MANCRQDCRQYRSSAGFRPAGSQSETAPTFELRLIARNSTIETDIKSRNIRKVQSVFVADQPIQNKEDDFLGRAGFAGHIGDAILKWKSKDALCLGLYGEWGSGKTSIINMCVEHIKEKTKDLKSEERPIIFRFNPWIISGQEAIVKSFLGHLRTILGKPDNAASARNAANLIGGLENFLGILSYIPSAGEVVKGAKEAIGSLKNATLALSEQLDGDLLGLKETISDELRKLNSPVIAIIDDIDRLSKEEIIAVFQLVKAVADFDNVIYFLAFDRKQVENCLEKIHEDYKYKYIDKIIQVGFDIPVPGQNKIKRYLLDNLDELINYKDLDEDEVHRYNNLKFGPLPTLFSNIREVKKYLNYVRFIGPIIENEVSMTDFFIMGAIHQFAPEIYETIINYQEVLVYDRQKGSIKPDYGKEKLQNILEIANRRNGKKFQNLISILFPWIEYLNNSFTSENFDICNKNKRICLKEHFDHLIELTTPEDAVSSQETSNIIKQIDNLELLAKELMEYMKDNRIDKLIERIFNDFSKSMSEQRIQNIIAAMILAEDDLSQIKPDSKKWSSRGDCSRIIDWILGKVDRNNRKGLLQNSMIQSGNSIVLPLSITYRNWRKWDHGDGEPVVEDEGNGKKLLTKSDVEEIKNFVLNKIRIFSKSNYQVKNWRLEDFHYCWKEWTDDDIEVESWKQEVLSDEKNIPNILRNFIRIVNSESIDGSRYRQYIKVKLADLGQFCNVVELVEKCQRLLSEKPDWLDEEDESIIKNFLNEYNNEKEEQDLDCSETQIETAKKSDY